MGTFEVGEVSFEVIVSKALVIIQYLTSEMVGNLRKGMPCPIHTSPETVHPLTHYWFPVCLEFSTEATTTRPLVEHVG